MAEKYYGIYAGTVLGRSDPANLGRLQVLVPGVVGGGTWAASCQPYHSTAIPPVNTKVWVMFQGGDPNYPVWIGCAAGE